MYRRQHEKALAKIVDRIVDEIKRQEDEIQRDIDIARIDPNETLKKLSTIQDLSSRRYQIKIVKREIRKILEDSKNLLVATIVERLNN